MKIENKQSGVLRLKLLGLHLKLVTGLAIQFLTYQYKAVEYGTLCMHVHFVERKLNLLLDIGCSNSLMSLLI